VDDGRFDHIPSITLKLQGLPLVDIPACRAWLPSNLTSQYKSFPPKRFERTMERVMYAVIRAGGKQYRVAPGDVVKIEKLPAADGDTIEFNDVLAVSGQEGAIGPGAGAVVSGQVLEGGESDKILVFHFKRKKQYKKIYGHRQPFTAVRITEIAFDGERFTAPDLPAPKPKKAKPASAEGEAAPAKSAKGKSKSKSKPKAAKKSAAKKAAKGKKK
jgi:large subunit ribosomal protein L21